MNHRTYDGWGRFSPLRPDQPAERQVPASSPVAVALGGLAARARTSRRRRWSTDFLYIVDDWGDRLQDRRALGRRRATSPGTWIPSRRRRRYARTAASRSRATIVILGGGAGRRASSPPTRTPARWPGNPTCRIKPDLEAQCGAARRQGQGLQRLVRRRPWDAGLDRGARRGERQGGGGRSSRFLAPGRARVKQDLEGTRTTPGRPAAASMWTTGTYDPASNQIFWGTGNPVPMFDPTYRPGDNLYTNSIISWQSGRRLDELRYFREVHARRRLGLRFDLDQHHHRRQRQWRDAQALVPVEPQRSCLYDGQLQRADAPGRRPATTVNWTKGIDQKTGKPVEYVPNADRQMYAGDATATLEHNNVKQCPTLGGGNNFWPSSYSPKTKLLYIPSDAGCNELKIDPSLSSAAGVWKGGVAKPLDRVEGDLIAVRSSWTWRGQEQGALALCGPCRNGRAPPAASSSRPSPTARSRPSTTRGRWS